MDSNRVTAMAVAALLSFATGPALAQAKTSSVSVSSGKEIRLGAYGGFQKDCSPGALHEVKVLSPPKNGSLVVKTASLKSSASSACPNKEGPAQVVFYQSKEAFAGTDTLTYQVRNPAGQTQSFTVSVTVAK